MSGGIQGIDTKGIKKILARSRKEQLMIGLFIGLTMISISLILDKVIFNDPIVVDPIVIERTIDTKELQLLGPETPSTSVEIPKIDDGDGVHSMDYAAFDEKVVTKKVGEKIIQSP